MKLRRSFILIVGALAAVAFLVGSSSQVSAQIGAGVVIDASDTLRITSVPDPGGHLTKERIKSARETLPPELVRPSKLRKVSLTRLEAEIARRTASADGITDDMRFLAGLTSIRYVFLYRETGDIVIAGPAEGYMHDITGRIVGIDSGKSVLELNDLVVALRAFPPSGHRTGMIGCSIDPTPEGLEQMRQWLMQWGGRATPHHTEIIATSLKEALGLQTVSVFGVPVDTHFAQVLVEADYRMKLIGIGLEKPPVKITSYVEKANPLAVSRNALQRWYFTPNYESVRVSHDEAAMELVGQGVKLVGENEVVGVGGIRAESAVVDPASQAFVKTFTKKYPELAKKVPVYAQLKNLIDMTIVAAYIQDRDFYTEAKWRMEVFGDEGLFSVQGEKAPKQVDTAVNAIWRGNRLMTPIGGGVEMRPRDALHNVLPDEDGRLSDAYIDGLDLEAHRDGRWWWD